MKCECPKGFPQTRTHFYQHLEGSKGGTVYRSGYLPIKVTWRGHTGECSLPDEVLRLRRMR